MKTYEAGKMHDKYRKLAEQEIETVPADKTFAKSAYEWNNALLIAAGKMWGNQPSLQKK